jgi:fatty acid desaturase
MKTLSLTFMSLAIITFCLFFYIAIWYRGGEFSGAIVFTPLVAIALSCIGLLFNELSFSPTCEWEREQKYNNIRIFILSLSCCFIIITLTIIKIMP